MQDGAATLGINRWRNCLLSFIREEKLKYFHNERLTKSRSLSILSGFQRHIGAIAQLGERLHGMQEVGGSIPPGSTKLRYVPIV